MERAVQRKPSDSRDGGQRGQAGVAADAAARVRMLQRQVGNRATRRILARYRTADELRQDLRAHPNQPLEEALRFLTALPTTFDVVHVIQHMDPGSRERLRAEAVRMDGVSGARLRLAFAHLRQPHLVDFYNARAADLALVPPRERGDILSVLPEAPIHAFGDYRGYRRLPSEALSRLAHAARADPRGTRRALNDALIAVIRTATTADDPQSEQFFRRIIEPVREGIEYVVSGPATATPAPEWTLAGPLGTTANTGPYDSHQHVLAIPDAPGRRPGPLMEQVIRINMPTARAPDGRRYPTVRAMADALTDLPPEVRRQIHTVSVEPRRHPRSHNAAASAGHAGDVSVYPMRGRRSRGDWRTLFTHEAGHTISMRNWGEITRDGNDRPVEPVPPGWRRWRSAMRSDGFHPSGYAQTDIEDDFAETFALYMGRRGTPEHERSRLLYPHRFALIDQLLRQDESTHHPWGRRPA